MARSPRIFLPRAIYHVYCRTARGEMVFSDRREATEFVNTIADVKRLHGFLVLGWCLMGNHYHLVIRTRDSPLWQSMARIQCRVARRHNRRRQLLGRLWQSRYKARIVQDDVHYKQLLAYVHLNPVAAGIVDDPGMYRWSGHAALIGRRAPRLVDCQAALRGFGEPEAAAREAYLEQIRAVAESRWVNSGVRHLPWWETVANDDQLMEPEDAENVVDYRGESIPPPSDRGVVLDDVVAGFCHAIGVNVDDLRSVSRSREIGEARRTFATLAVLHLGYSVVEVAATLRKHPGSVSRWLESSRCERDRPEIIPELRVLLGDSRGM